MKFAGKVRAARGFLNWMQDDLASHAGLGIQSIRNIESESSSPTARTQKKIERAFEHHGVTFTSRGIEITESPIIYEGKQGFEAFMNDVYDVANKEGGDICLFNTQPSLWIKHLGQEWYDMHSKRMAKIANQINVRIAIKEGDDSFILSVAEYRWIPKDKWKDTTFYAYGSKLGLLSFKDDDIKITVIKEAELADSFRALYDMAWENITSEIPQEAGKK